MSINLEKGQRIDLTKDKPADTSYCVGLGWDPNSNASSTKFDLDAVAFVLKGGKLVDDKAFIYYGNLIGHGLEHTGDNLTGDGDGDDEQIKINFSQVDGDEILFAVNIHLAKERSQNFGMVNNSFIRIFNPSNNEEFFKFELQEDFSTATQLVVGKLYSKDGKDWKFAAHPEAFSEGLESLLNKYR